MKSQTTLYLLILLILFQSCVTYQKVPILLSEAHGRGKVKVISKSGEIKIFKNKIHTDTYKNLTNKFNKLNSKKWRLGGILGRKKQEICDVINIVPLIIVEKKIID